MAEGSGRTTTPEAQITPENYSFLQERIYRDSGIVLDDTKRYLIESRLLPLVRRENLGTLNDLCALLRGIESTPLRRQVVEAMTTNETLFFRDIAVFRALQNKILPEIAAAHSSSKSIEIWSAAASSGQEAYSLAILLSELGLGKWHIRILGTDLNSQMLEYARRGCYTQLEVNRGLPAKYLLKYFERKALDWQVKDELRRMVRFQNFDLRQSMRTLGSFDLVLCRNVLIYFDVPTKKQVLGAMRGVLKPKGLLLLGSAETTLNLDDRFHRQVIEQAAFYQTH